jgi:hypothetical protein
MLASPLLLLFACRSRSRSRRGNMELGTVDGSKLFVVEGRFCNKRYRNGLVLPICNGKSCLELGCQWRD